MKDVIRWGIWGTGTVAQAFIRGLLLVPGVEVVSVTSRSAERAQQFAKAFGIRRWHADPAEMLADRALDVVYIATPNHLHREHSLRAIAAGKAVLCEKPFALNAAEAREVADAAKNQRVFCMEGMWMRFMPLVQRVRLLAMDGQIGRVLGLTADFGLPVQEDPAAAAWQQATGGGALLDRGIYCLSLASLLLGEVTDVSSVATLTEGGVDATSSYSLRFRSGAFAVLWASLRAQGTNEAVLLGSQSNLRLHEPFIRPHRLTLSKAREAATPNREPPNAPGLKQKLKENFWVQQVLRRAQPVLSRYDEDWFEPVAATGFQFEADEVTRCVRNGALESTEMSLAETVRILELIDQIRACWKESR